MAEAAAAVARMAYAKFCVLSTIEKHNSLTQKYIHNPAYHDLGRKSETFVRIFGSSFETKSGHYPIKPVLQNKLVCC
jgi:hypothetical protein